MSNPLQEQLRKAGLVNDKQLKKAQKDQRKDRLRAAEQKGPGPDDDKARIQQAQAEKAARDRELNRQKKEADERKAVAAQVKQIIEANRQPGEAGEIPFNFTDGSTVKRIYVTEVLRKRIVAGQVAIVKLEGKYELVSAEIAERIAARDASFIVLRNEFQKTGNEEADDPYAAYQVPDDLMW